MRFIVELIYACQHLSRIPSEECYSWRCRGSMLYTFIGDTAAETEYVSEKGKCRTILI